MGDRIDTEADLARHIAALAAMDGAMAHVAAAVPEVPLRRLPGGLAGLLRIVMGQQLSIHAAAAVWQRLETAAGTVDAANLGGLSDEALRAAGLSRQKIRTLRAIVAAEIEPVLADPPNDEALRKALLSVPGVGPWTADLYLLVCAGAPDVLPAGDLALRKAARAALDLADDPAVAELEATAARWSPHRSAASRLLWAYYRTLKTPALTATAVDARAPV